MSSFPKRIKRRGQPSLLDTAPLGTECIIKREENFTIYVQLSSNENKPKWEYVGTFPHETAPATIQEEIVRIKQLKL